MREAVQEVSTEEWIKLCRVAVEGIRQVLARDPTIGARAAETGMIGAGGDRTLVIDASAEELIFAALDRLHEAGHRFTAISEERGLVEYGAAAPLVVIDPIDGSLNAKRGIPHHAFSLAVSDGPTMADVSFGYVFDFGPGEEWWAARGAGARLGGVLLDREVGERRGGDGRLEVLGIESVDPRWIVGHADALARSAHRLRALGTIASSICQVAAGRFDGLISLRNCRAVDAAAAQLILREAGGFVSFPALDPSLAAPLDLIARSPVVAARSEHTLAELARVTG